VKSVGPVHSTHYSYVWAGRIGLGIIIPVRSVYSVTPYSLLWPVQNFGRVLRVKTLERSLACVMKSVLGCRHEIVSERYFGSLRDTSVCVTYQVGHCQASAF